MIFMACPFNVFWEDTKIDVVVTAQVPQIRQRKPMISDQRIVSFIETLQSDAFSGNTTV
jgi:hypothetical protein